MRKQELVQLHALRSQVRERVERRYDLPDGAFERYDRLGVPPTAIYRKKGAHEEALDRLLSDLTATLEAHVEEPSDGSPIGSTPTGDEIPGRRPAREGVPDRQ